MLTDYPTVVLVNESTALSDRDAWRIAWCLNYQVRWQFGPIWKIGADVTFLPKGVAVPSGAWILHALDTMDQEGALGYHDEDGNRVPYSRIGVKTTLNDGQAVAEVFSHECMEMLVDPHVNMTAFDPRSGRLYATEVGDPAQGGAYDLAAPYNRPAFGVTMSDFALPGWFDPSTPADEITSYRGVCKGPFNLGKAGYVSYTSALPPKWESEFGEEADRRLFDHDERVQRRLVAAAQ